MAAAYDSVTPDTESGAGVTTLTSGSWTIAGSDRVLFGFMATGDSSAAAHTGGSNGMAHPAAGSVITNVANLAISTHARLSAWSAIAPAASAATTKGTWGASQGEAGIGAVSYTGVHQTTPNGTAATATGAVSSATSATATVNVSTTAGDKVLACAFLHLTTGAVNPTVTEGSGCTPRYDLEGAQMGGFAAVMIIERDAVGSSTTMSADFAFSTASGTWGIVAFVVNPSSSATIDQEGTRFGNDDGNEASFTFAAAQDANITAPIGTNLLARFLLNSTGDHAAATFNLRYQKNGSGGYADVPAGATTKPTPVIETADCTVSGSNTAASTWAVAHPAAAIGDLLIFYIAWDDSTATTDVTEPAGPNGETLLEINATPVTDGLTETRAKGWYCVATGSWSASTRTFTPSATESWSATCIKVPAGEFDPTTPIGAVGTAADSGGGTDTTVDSPAFSAGASDGGGRLVWCAGVDADPLVTLASGWTSRQTQDLGAVAHGVATRDAAVTNSESISSVTWSIGGDSWTSLAFIVRAPTVNNEIYVATSSNITAGGEATTARLTAPAGKTTSDFTTGRRWDDENNGDTIDIVVDDYTEVEWCLQAQSPAVNGDYFDLRIYDGGAPLSGYSVTPRWTLGTAAAASSAPPQVLQRSRAARFATLMGF